MSQKTVYCLHSILVDMTEDKFDEGMVGGEDDCVLHDESPNTRFHSLADLFSRTIAVYGLPTDPKDWEIVSDGEVPNGTRITTQWTITINLGIPSDKEIEDWKNGKQQLFTATAYLWIVKCVEENAPESEITQALGIK
jgi:hypothetical protein